MYLADDIDGKLSVPKIYAEQLEKYGEKKGKRLFDIWFESYRYVDIIDTGCYDCHCEAYVSKAEESAKLIHSQVQFVEGSNILLEKLVSGRWDEQFIVAEKGQVLEKEDFL
jgi:hypothetical protein